MTPEFEASGWIRVGIVTVFILLGVWKAIDILIWYATF